MFDISKKIHKSLVKERITCWFVSIKAKRELKMAKRRKKKAKKKKGKKKRRR